jgi:hypothetical protein
MGPMSCLLFEIQVSGGLLTARQEDSVYAWPMEDGAQGRHLLMATDGFLQFSSSTTVGLTSSLYLAAGVKAANSTRDVEIFTPIPMLWKSFFFELAKVGKTY